MPLARGIIAHRSNQSAGAQREPTWIGTPGATFTEDVAANQSLRSLLHGFDDARHGLDLEAGTLASGLTLDPDPDQGYVHDGSGSAGTSSGLQIMIRNKGDLDWNARKNAAGVTQAIDFSGVDDFVDANTNGGHVFAGGMDPAVLARVVRDASDGLSNGCCLRINTPKAAGANSAAYMFPLNRDWTNNSQSFGANEFFVQFRFKIPSSRLFLSDCGGNQRGWKSLNLAQYSPTNTNSQSFSNSTAEHVLQDSDQIGAVQGYNRSAAGSFDRWEGSAGGQVTFQDVDRGAAYTVPGDRYCHYPAGSKGCEYYPVNEWVTIKVRLKIPSYIGSAGNECDVWMLRWGATVPVQIYSRRNYSVGDPDDNEVGFTGINGGHFLTFETNRVSNSPFNIMDTYHLYDQLLVSTLDPAWPAVGC